LWRPPGLTCGRDFSFPFSWGNWSWNCKLFLNLLCGLCVSLRFTAALSFCGSWCFSLFLFQIQALLCYPDSSYLGESDEDASTLSSCPTWISTWLLKYLFIEIFF
jgi:hypothetical protein